MRLLAHDRQLVDDRGAAVQEDAAGLGQFQTAAPAIAPEELDPEMILQILDLLADRGRRDIELVGRRPERALLRDLDEMLKLGQAREDGAAGHGRVSGERDEDPHDSRCFVRRERMTLR
ncbi:hypothetical protein OH818_17585 [Jiella pelagia]|uniref:Uncharacterized protein n=1 Tax=Jiella pelagia TaxID=2986949 RepID=A0ABY7BWA2_9HYPH|nr:hypothetical protein [Jiella pelagia]WAP67350.1 hypothetical protein OH818_17585 [Jiella pelagia]